MDKTFDKYWEEITSRVIEWVTSEGLGDDPREWGRAAYRKWAKSRGYDASEYALRVVGGWTRVREAVASRLGIKTRAVNSDKSRASRMSSKDMLKFYQLQTTVRDLRRRERELLHALEQADRRQGVLDVLDDARQQWIPHIQRRGVDAFNKREATAVVLCSDWHVEERVDPATINGMNEFGPEIAKQRVARLCDGIEWLVRLNRRGFEIENIILWFGGDIITGYIHEELLESNALSPTEATVLAGELMVEVVERVRAIGGFRQIIVPCNYGNHGRTTPRPRVATAAKNSFEWLAYKTLAGRYRLDPTVRILVATGDHLYVDVYDWTLRFHHGDAIRYYGGVGGISIPFRKALAEWDSFRRADLTCIGHYHTYIPPHRGMACNGSLIGYNAYALRIKSRYEPPAQSFFLIDSKHFVCQATPIWLNTSGDVTLTGGDVE